MATRPTLKPSKYSRRLLKVREEISKVKSRSGFNKSRISSTGVDERVSERWDALVTIFLSFCTVCEKQIVIPSDFILYRSERCRSQDPLCSVPEYPFHDIVPQRLPAQVPPRCFVLAPFGMHSYNDIPGQHDSGELGNHPSITSRRTFPCLPIVDCPLRSMTTIEGTFEAANGEIFWGKSCSLPISAARESIKRLFLADMYHRGRL
ncbi:hypothetical protein DM02DRAFT_664176 [Periconia macrospinosa]|uniref:Uncharacterized protein n=1 Tax=Periconia macrospinosa TaxID=97972 RepID=A0A2V1D0X8_9PLEO|nr:hypothetical protein DM02DRAFT_664176 [Periconia macrospinosa]